MKITYIHHSAFLVELETVVLLFDYTEGLIPVTDGKKPMVIFASHSHGDHYSKEILELNRESGVIHYILSNDISKKGMDEKVLNQVHFVKPGETILLPYGNDEKAKLEINTYRSTDKGVAFLVKGDGQVIYHAGDLNNWRWEGEPEDWNNNMAKRYSAEVDKMAGMKIDAAFLPLDPRQENAFYLGFDEFMKKTQVTHAFPMHCWGDFSVIKRLREMEVSAPYRDRIVMISKDGEEFLLGTELESHG